MKKALVLAAGKGKRLRLFTRAKPKPLIGIVGEPVLGYAIRKSLFCGLKEIVFVVGYEASQVVEYIREEEATKGFEATIIEQREQLGTGHAVKLAKEEIGREEFLLLYGDLYFGDDVLPWLLRAHRNSGLRCTMTLVEVGDAGSFGVVEVDGEMVSSIMEKPGINKKGLINAGIYAFSPRLFEELDTLERSTRGEYEVTDAINRLSKTMEVGYIRIPSDIWVDIGRPWDVLDANMAELGRIGARRREVAPVTQPSFIGEDVYIGKGSSIGPYAVLEDGVWVEDRCKIYRSVVMAGARIGAESIISESVIGYNAEVGRKTRTETVQKTSLRVEIEGHIYELGSRRLGAMVGSGAYVPPGLVLKPGEIVP